MDVISDVMLCPKLLLRDGICGRRLYLAAMFTVLAVQAVAGGSCRDSHDVLDCQVNGGCYARHYECNGVANCNFRHSVLGLLPDNTDEQNCTSCTGKSYHCEAKQMCINSSARCNGIDDCGDSEDERSCTSCTGSFHCETEQQCIPESTRCNGIVECLDSADDEQNCDETTVGRPTTGRTASTRSHQPAATLLPVEMYTASIPTVQLADAVQPKKTEIQRRIKVQILVPMGEGYPGEQPAGAAKLRGCGFTLVCMVLCSLVL